MIIDFMAYLAGLMMPIAFLLGFLGRWFPSLHFSWNEYIEEMGGRDPTRRHWHAGFGLAILTWVVLALYLLLSAYLYVTHSLA
ncbi:MAG: hypothetical protein AB3X44_08475 [Leptothrix sp. (in: b-proteobacteria)]